MIREAAPRERRRIPPAGLELVPARRLLVDALVAWLPLAPGDRVLVSPGDRVAAGLPLAECSRGGRTVVVRMSPAEAARLRPGAGWPAEAVEGEEPGEALFAVAGRWRVAVGERHEVVAAPAAGTIGRVDPGRGMQLQLGGRAILGRALIGSAVRGPLDVAVASNAELRATAVDVGRAGAVVVAGAHIDAEALTRARATGLRGIVVGGLGAAVRRDLSASESRRLAGLHPTDAFGVLVLDGMQRRPIASPVAALLRLLERRQVALIADPPALVVDDPPSRMPAPPRDLVRFLAGPYLGREGRWLGLAGRRRSSGGGVAVDSLAGLVAIDGFGTVAAPIGDLERFV